MPRGGHSAVSVNGKVLMWGGLHKDGRITENSKFRIVETFKSGQWGSIATNWVSPTGRGWLSGSVVFNGTS